MKGPFFLFAGQQNEDSVGKTVSIYNKLDDVSSWLALGYGESFHMHLPKKTYFLVFTVRVSNNGWYGETRGIFAEIGLSLTLHHPFKINFATRWHIRHITFRILWVKYTFFVICNIADKRRKTYNIRLIITPRYLLIAPISYLKKLVEFL